MPIWEWRVDGCSASANPSFVMPGHSRPKDGVATLAYVPGIHALLGKREDVDA